jgi:hypothetical protein
MLIGTVLPSAISAQQGVGEHDDDDVINVEEEVARHWRTW